MTADQRKREEATLCGLRAHEDAIHERNQLREVLRDVVEERGLGDSLRKLYVLLEEARQQLKAAAFAANYAAMPLATTVPAHMKVREVVEQGLALLYNLTRPSEPPMKVLQTSSECRVCGAAANIPCNVARHSAAWCYHEACGRVMRGGVCDHCGMTPPMAQVTLLPTVEVRQRPQQAADGRFYCRLCGTVHAINEGCDGTRYTGLMGDTLGLHEVSEQFLTEGPRTAWCGECSAAPGVRCSRSCSGYMRSSDL